MYQRFEGYNMVIDGYYLPNDAKDYGSAAPYRISFCPFCGKPLEESKIKSVTIKGL